MQEYLKRLSTGYKSLSLLKQGIIISIFSVIVSIARRPDIVTNPQFWAEDSTVFFAGAYHFGTIHTVFEPYSGFLWVLQRIVAGLSQFLPIQYAPMAFNIVAILIMALPIFILWSDKILFVRNRYKSLLIFTYLFLLLPNFAEIHGNLTNSGWYLSFSAVLVLLRPHESSKRWAFFDIAVILLSCLTGPTAIFLILPAFYKYFKSKKNSSLIQLTVIVSSAILQIIIYTQQKSASLTILAQSEEIITNIHRPIAAVGVRLIEMPLIGGLVANKHIAESLQAYLYGAIVISMFVIAYKTLKDDVRIIILFTGALFMAALLRVNEGSISVLWEVFQTTDFAQRYFFIPMVAWIIILLFLAYSKNEVINASSRTLLLLFCLTFPLTFAIPQYKRMPYKESIDKLLYAPVGAEVCIKQNPDVNMCLLKHN